VSFPAVLGHAISVAWAAEGPTRGSTEQIATIGVSSQARPQFDVRIFRLCAVRNQSDECVCGKGAAFLKNANGPDTAKIAASSYRLWRSRAEWKVMIVSWCGRHASDTQKRGERQILGNEK